MPRAQRRLASRGRALKRGRISTGAAPCAQRRLASRGRALSHHGPAAPHPASAQRRLASRGRARPGCHTAGVPWQVLNADWHHGDGHIQCAPFLVSAFHVLNADWHHGDGHSRVASAVAARVGAQRRLASRGRALYAVHGVRVPWTVCSTPIGITGTGTRETRATAPCRSCAQRRLASRGRAQANRLHQTELFRCAQRRLASRGRAPGVMVVTTSRKSRAQRRLASRGRAHGKTEIEERRAMCSTPIGITGTGTARRELLETTTFLPMRNRDIE